MVLGKLDRYVQKNKTGPPSNTTHKNKFKWTKDLNVRAGIVKILKENINSKIVGIACRNILQIYLPRQGKQTNKKKHEQWGHIKLQGF